MRKDALSVVGRPGWVVKIKDTPEKHYTPERMQDAFTCAFHFAPEYPSEVFWLGKDGAHTRVITYDPAFRDVIADA